MRSSSYRYGIAVVMVLVCCSISHGGGFANSGPKGTAPANPAVVSDSYAIDDGSADDSIGITGSDPNFDVIWLNSFARQAGHERINQISVAYGSPIDQRSYDGLPVKILLYGDSNGGSPTDATLLYSFNTTIAGANTNTFQSYAVPNIAIPGTFLVGVVAKNMVTNNAFVAGIDYTAPTFPGVSYGGYTYNANTLNEANLASVPNFSTMESAGINGNWLVRANGVALPEPASLATLGLSLGAALLWRRRETRTNLR